MAGSPNAFATLQAQRHSSVLTEQEPNARPPKRTRLSSDAVAAIHTQCAQPDISAEVDHMILDYLAHQTIQACLASRSLATAPSSPHSLSSNLAMSNAFLSVFKNRHPAYMPDAELRLRILLLRLATLFTQRPTCNPTTPAPPALLALRAKNNTRARSWIASTPSSLPSSNFDPSALDTALPLPLPDLERNRAHALHSLGIPPEDEDYEDAFYGTSSCISLLDILPLFVELSAARNAINNSTLTHRWMKLACEFMMQACLEQYLIFGAGGSDAVDEAFAWGYQGTASDPMDIDGIDGTFKYSDVDVSAMFEDEEYEIEVEGWNEMRGSYIQVLFPYDATSTPGEGDHGKVIPHLEAVAAEYPIAAFESSLLQFLDAISKSLSEPVLLQLESGKLDSMTERETQDFLAECGIGVARFFQRPISFKSEVT